MTVVSLVGINDGYVGDCLCGGMVIVEEVMKVVVIYAVVIIMVRTTVACERLVDL